MSLVLYLRINCQIQDHENISLFSFNSFKILTATFWFLVYFLLVLYMMLGSNLIFFFLHMAFSCASTICWRQYTSSHWIVLVLFSISVNLRCIGLFLESQFYFIDLCIINIFMQAPYCLEITIVSFENEEYESSCFILFFFLPNLLWFFWISLNSIWISGSLIYFFKKFEESFRFW